MFLESPPPQILFYFTGVLQKFGFSKKGYLRCEGFEGHCGTIFCGTIFCHILPKNAALVIYSMYS